MKAIITIALLFLPFFSNAQLQDVLIENDWYLYSVSINGQETSPPNNEEVTTVPLNFLETNTVVDFVTTVCNLAFGNITVDEPTYSFTFNEGLGFTAIDCNNSENATFEGLYFGFYNDNVTEVFTCEIVFIDDGEGGGFIDLKVIAPNGDYAHYFDFILSSEEFTEPTFSMYPNPVENNLYFKSNLENDTISILIYDVFGKLILSEKIKQSENSINVQSLNRGIYFVAIKDESGNTSVKRLIKI